MVEIDAHPLSERLQAILLNIVEVAPLEAVGERLAAAALDLTHADHAAIGVYGRDGGLEHFVTAGLSTEEQEAIGHPPAGVGLLGAFARDPSTISLRDSRDHPRSSAMPPGHPPIGPFLGVPVVYASRTVGAFYVTRSPGGEPFGDEEERYLRDLAPYAAIAVGNALVLEHEQRRADAAAILVRAASALQAGEDAGDTGAVLLQALNQLFPDDVHAVALGDAGGGAQGPIVMPDGSPLAAELQSLFGERLATGEHRIPGVIDGNDLIVHVAGLSGEVRVMLGCTCGVSSGDIDRDALRQLAEIGSIGLAASRRRAAESALERYDIRDAIARDLHDDLIQSIYAIGLGLRAGAGERADPAALRDTLSTASHDLNGVIRDLRSYIAQLSGGSELTSTGLLIARIEALLRGQGGRPRWAYRLDLGDALLGPRLERQLYLIVRESISNILRHAHAANASLVLRRVDGELHMRISDDGRGFDRDVIPDGAVGLRSIEERVADLGGSIVIESTPGAGTILTATFPPGDEIGDA